MQAKNLSDLVTFTRASVASYVNASGLIATAGVNAPRFEFHPLTGEPLGLKMEVAKTNVCINSEVLTAGLGVTVTANSTAAPDGALTADSLVETTANSEHYAGDFTFTPTAGSTYTWSLFAKRGAGSRNLYVRVAGGSVALTNFNFDTKIAVATGANVVSGGFQELKSGWFRVWVTFTAAASSVTTFRAQMLNGLTAVYTGDGSSSLVLWGRQVELSSAPTSYIQTAATSVTKAADALVTVDVSSNLRQGEGTFYLEADYGTVENAEGAAVIGSTPARVLLRRISRQGSASVSDDAGIVVFSYAGGAVIPEGTTVKQAVAYRHNDFQSATNGALSPADSLGSTPTGLNSIRAYPGMNGHVKKIQVFPYRLSAVQLQALTT